MGTHDKQERFVEINALFILGCSWRSAAWCHCTAFQDWRRLI